jgi:hypothetical protein
VEKSHINGTEFRPGPGFLFTARLSFSSAAFFDTGHVLLKNEALACQILINLGGLPDVGCAYKHKDVEFNSMSL